jgi:hypothetical protein
MALETGTFISDLNTANPTGSDALAFADDHLRLIKTTIKNTFPSVTGAVTKTHTQLNNALDKTGDTMTGLLTLSGAPTSDLHAATKAYVDTVNTAVTAKADKTTTVTAGAGLSGGGDLSANRTLAIADTGVTAGSYGTATGIPVITVNARGQLTAVSTVAPQVSLEYTLASSDGSAASRSIYLTTGDWTLVLDTRATINDVSNYDFSSTQSATLNSVSVSTSIPFRRSGGSGYGRQVHGSDIQVATVSITTAGTYTLALNAATPNGATMTGSKVTVYKA